MQVGQGLTYSVKGRVSVDSVVFTGGAASSEEKNETKNTSFESVFQNPWCVGDPRGLWFVPVEILPLCGAALQGARCVFLSIERPVFRVTSRDWSYLRRKPEEEESKESEMIPSQVRGLCFFGLSFLKCCIFGLDKLLNFWMGLFGLNRSHHPKGPIALLAHQCDRKHCCQPKKLTQAFKSRVFIGV